MDRYGWMAAVVEAASLSIHAMGTFAIEPGAASSLRSSS
jgi:hypothetical protein